jgi:hypothetical protein
MGVILKRSGDHSCPSFRHAAFLPGADSRQLFNLLAAKQRALAKPQLCDLQAWLLGPQGSLEKFSRQVLRVGRKARGLDHSSAPGGARHRQLAEKSAHFVLALHRRYKLTTNPFSGMNRRLLCCVVFDDAAPYTLAERFAAAQALRQHDSEYFAQLIATTRHTVERRLVFIGLLEHFDALMPIEQSIYPLDYRTVQQGHLNREEAIYGPLQLDKPVMELLEEHSPKWLLENLCISGVTDTA